MSVSLLQCLNFGPETSVHSELLMLLTARLLGATSLCLSIPPTLARPGVPSSSPGPSLRSPGRISIFGLFRNKSPHSPFSAIHSLCWEPKQTLLGHVPTLMRTLRGGLGQLLQGEKARGSKTPTWRLPAAPQRYPAVLEPVADAMCLVQAVAPSRVVRSQPGVTKTSPAHTWCVSELGLLSSGPLVGHSCAETPLFQPWGHQSPWPVLPRVSGRYCCFLHYVRNNGEHWSETKRIALGSEGCPGQCITKAVGVRFIAGHLGHVWP